MKEQNAKARLNHELRAGAESEFACFLGTLKILGIAHSWNTGGYTKAQQTMVDQAGFSHLSALACTPVIIGETEFVFASGAAQYAEDEEEVGPHGLFLFSRNTKTGEITPRRMEEENRNFRGKPSSEGLAALAMTYQFAQ